MPPPRSAGRSRGKQAVLFGKKEPENRHPAGGTERFAGTVKSSLGPIGTMPCGLIVGWL
jgi:hypothetical protein